MEKYKVKILEIKDTAQGTKTYYLEKPEGLHWDEGAHTHLAHIGFDQGEAPDKTLVRHMSICTVPREGIVGFTTRVPGSGSPFKLRLSELQVGDELVLFKVGSRMKLKRDGNQSIMLSMGVGIATMRPMIHAFLESSEGISKLININVDRSEDFVYKSELEPLETEVYVNHWVRSRKEFYQVLDNVSELSEGNFYLVGSDAFIVDVGNYLMEKGVPTSAIAIDKKDDKIAELLKPI